MTAGEIRSEPTDGVWKPGAVPQRIALQVPGVACEGSDMTYNVVGGEPGKAHASSSGSAGARGPQAEGDGARHLDVRIGPPHRRGTARAREAPRSASCAWWRYFRFRRSLHGGSSGFPMHAGRQARSFSTRADWGCRPTNPKVNRAGRPWVPPEQDGCCSWSTQDEVRRFGCSRRAMGKGYQTLLKEFVLERLYEEEKREGLVGR